MNRSSRSADQLFLVLLTEQGRGVSSCPDSLTNMAYRVRAALVHPGVPPQASLIQGIPEQGVSSSLWPALPAPVCTRGRTSPIQYMRSSLSHIKQIVKFLEDRHPTKQGDQLGFLFG